MNILTEIFMVSTAGYALYHAIQMLRGRKLNFKPFNCCLCITFWLALFYILLVNYPFINIIHTIIFPLSVSGISYFIKIIEDKLIQFNL